MFTIVKLSNGNSLQPQQVREQLLHDGAVTVDGTHFIPHLIAVINDSMAIHCQTVDDWNVYKLFVSNWLVYAHASHL